jgi:hypothetical protein
VSNLVSHGARIAKRSAPTEIILFVRSSWTKWDVESGCKIGIQCARQLKELNKWKRRATGTTKQESTRVQEHWPIVTKHLPKPVALCQITRDRAAEQLMRINQYAFAAGDTLPDAQRVSEVVP